MIACGRSDDDDGGGGGTTKSKSGCVQRARQADWTTLVHGLCAAIIALTTLRILPALAACLVSVCFLQSPVLRTLSCGLYRFLGLRGRRSSKADGRNIGTGLCGRPAPRRRSPLGPPAAPSTTDDDVPPPTPPSTSGNDVLPGPPSTNALPVVKRSLRLLMPVVRGIRRSVVIHPKRSKRSSLRRRDTASKTTVTTVTARDNNNIITKTVSSFRDDSDVVHFNQYLVCATAREQR